MTRSCRSKPHRTSLKDPHVVMVLPASKLKNKQKRNGLNWNSNVGCTESSDQLRAENAGHSHFV